MTRNEEVRQLREEGKTLEFIGGKFNISRERVRQICKKMGVTKGYEPDIAKMLHKKTSYPSNIVCVNADGHLVFIGDGGEHWVEVHNKKLKEAIKDIYGLQNWIE